MDGWMCWSLLLNAAGLMDPRRTKTPKLTQGQKLGTGLLKLDLPSENEFHIGIFQVPTTKIALTTIVIFYKLLCNPCTYIFGDLNSFCAL